MIGKKAASTNWLLLGVLGVVIYLLAGGSLNLNGGSSPAPAVGDTDIFVCGSDTTPDLDINAYNAEDKDTALVETTNSYRKLGSTTWTTFTAGTAITNLEVNAQYEVLMGGTTSTQSAIAYGQYFVTDKIPCKELVQMDVPMYNDETAAGITATFYNRDNNNAIETFGAGQIKNVYVHFEAGNNEVFGNPFIADSGISGPQRSEYPNVLCLNLTTASWDVPEKVSYEGVELKPVSQPTIHAATASHSSYCYEAPIITEDGQKITIRLDADDSVNPSANETATIYAAGFYMDEDGNVQWGVEDDDKTAVAAAAGDTLLIMIA